MHLLKVFFLLSFNKCNKYAFIEGLFSEQYSEFPRCHSGAESNTVLCISSQLVFMWTSFSWGPLTIGSKRIAAWVP